VHDNQFGRIKKETKRKKEGKKIKKIVLRVQDQGTRQSLVFCLVP